jgi:predicted CXXCH cytochrome family protein
MRTRSLLVAAAAAILLPVPGRGVDAPHNAATIPNARGCEDCHLGHNAPGGGLTNQPDNFTVCTHCHNLFGAAFSFGGAWYTSGQAAPGSGGVSHHADSAAANAARGATPPVDPRLQAYTAGGYVQCSSCHDPHAAGAANAPANLHVSVETGTPLAKSGGTGAGTMTLTVGSSAVAKGYRVRIGPAANQFQVSHNARYSAAALVTWGAAYSIPGASGAVALTHADDDPAVSVGFSAASMTIGDYWDFYVGFPFLRMPIAEGEMCVDCHAARNQRHSDVETTSTYGWASGKPFSHPVGEGLDSNAMHYDVATPLEVNGAPQGPTPTSSYLELSPAGNVTCLTCHAVHNADSDSQTMDAR